MTSFDDTPFEDKIAKAVKRRFWLTKAALGRPEIKQDKCFFLKSRTAFYVLLAQIITQYSNTSGSRSVNVNSWTFECDV